MLYLQLSQIASGRWMLAVEIRIALCKTDCGLQKIYIVFKFKFTVFPSKPYWEGNEADSLELCHVRDRNLSM